MVVFPYNLFSPCPQDAKVESIETSLQGLGARTLSRPSRFTTTLYLTNNTNQDAWSLFYEGALQYGSRHFMMVLPTPEPNWTYVRLVGLEIDNKIGDMGVEVQLNVEVIPVYPVRADVVTDSEGECICDANGEVVYVQTQHYIYTSGGEQVFDSYGRPLYTGSASGNAFLTDANGQLIGVNDSKRRSIESACDTSLTSNTSVYPYNSNGNGNGLTSSECPCSSSNGGGGTPPLVVNEYTFDTINNGNFVDSVGGIDIPVGTNESVQATSDGNALFHDIVGSDNSIQFCPGEPTVLASSAVTFRARFIRPELLGGKGDMSLYGVTLTQNGTDQHRMHLPTDPGCDEDPHVSPCCDDPNIDCCDEPTMHRADGLDSWGSRHNGLRVNIGTETVDSHTTIIANVTYEEYLYWCGFYRVHGYPDFAARYDGCSYGSMGKQNRNTNDWLDSTQMHDYTELIDPAYTKGANVTTLDQWVSVGLSIDANGKCWVAFKDPTGGYSRSIGVVDAASAAELATTCIRVTHNDVTQPIVMGDVIKYNESLDGAALLALL